MKSAPEKHARCLLLSLAALLVALEGAQAVITLQIGGATRLGSSLSRQRDRYSCYWDCDLVGCQIARDDDECAYDCEKICRVRYDYAGRSAGQPEQASGSAAAAAASALDATAALNGKSAAEQLNAAGDKALPQQAGEQLETVGHPVRLHLPRNVSARNFGFWERCGQEAANGKQFESSFSI